MLWLVALTFLLGIAVVVSAVADYRRTGREMEANAVVQAESIAQYHR